MISLKFKKGNLVIFAEDFSPEASRIVWSAAE